MSRKTSHPSRKKGEPGRRDRACWKANSKKRTRMMSSLGRTLAFWSTVATDGAGRPFLSRSCSVETLRRRCKEHKVVSEHAQEDFLLLAGPLAGTQGRAEQ